MEIPVGVCKKSWSLTWDMYLTVFCQNNPILSIVTGSTKIGLKQLNDSKIVILLVISRLIFQLKQCHMPLKWLVEIIKTSVLTIRIWMSPKYRFYLARILLWIFLASEYLRGCQVNSHHVLYCKSWFVLSVLKHWSFENRQYDVIKCNANGSKSTFIPAL